MIYIGLFFAIFLFSIFLLEPYLRRDSRLDQFVAERASSGNAKEHSKREFSKVLSISSFGSTSQKERQQIILKLRAAGFWGLKPVLYFRTARYICPVILFLFGMILAFNAELLDQLHFTAKLAVAGFFGVVGVFIPGLFLQNRIIKRRAAVRKAWSDALDLMLVCMEAGMTIEAAIAKVANTIQFLSKELSEELYLTVAEFNLYPDRREAYHNFAKRTEIESIQAFVQCVVQAERYGTPMGQALRLLAHENREQRLQLAERKAAALPPKLTVPMILFFLPVIFAVILTPAIIQIAAQGGIMGGN